MTERVGVRDLNELDGFAVRVLRDVVVIISSAVPHIARELLAEELSAAVRSAPGRYTTVARHIRDADHEIARGPATPHRIAKGVVTMVVRSG